MQGTEEETRGARFLFGLEGSHALNLASDSLPDWFPSDRIAKILRCVKSFFYLVDFLTREGLDSRSAVFTQVMNQSGSLMTDSFENRITR